MNDKESAAELLATEIRAAYPNLSVTVIEKNETAYVDQADVPDELVEIAVRGISVIDPYSSECTCFPVDPEAYYGIPQAIAQRVSEHNRVAFR
ncbi:MULTISPECIES: hypothetical protein [Herbaspirillum]|uniref:Uncharacterized protein n=2 Tax=Herbaspirillum huttiense TaxID=863372 RepID=A0AAJ2LVV1_9BURK|nr:MULTISPECIES: hypothetical protein [Herbaspirillum]MDR9836883.1 hypothetical protein [Herbaspirillum huttiense]